MNPDPDPDEVADTDTHTVADTDTHTVADTDTHTVADIPEDRIKEIANKIKNGQSIELQESESVDQIFSDKLIEYGITATKLNPDNTPSFKKHDKYIIISKYINGNKRLLNSIKCLEIEDGACVYDIPLFNVHYQTDRGNIRYYHKKFLRVGEFMDKRNFFITGQKLDIPHKFVVDVWKIQISLLPWRRWRGGSKKSKNNRKSQKLRKYRKSQKLRKYRK